MLQLRQQEKRFAVMGWLSTEMRSLDVAQLEFETVNLR
jgi:hypothetical protein